MQINETRKTILLSLLTLSAMALLAPPATASRANSAPTIWLLFSRGHNIWGLTRKGQQIELLQNADSACWSWDGTRTAFLRFNRVIISPISRPSLEREICLLPTGSQQKSLLNDVDATDITWEPDNRYLQFSVFQPFRLSGNGLEDSPSELTLGSIWTVSSIYNGMSEPSLWISPIMRGWWSIGAVSVCAPEWDVASGELYFVRAGSVWRASITGSSISGQFSGQGPEKDFDWDPSLVIPFTPDAGGTSEPDAVGYSQVSVSKNGLVMTLQLSRWNGSGDQYIEVRRVHGGYWKKIKSLLGINASVTRNGREVIYEGYYGKERGNVFAWNVSTGRRRLIVKNARRPLCNPAFVEPAS